MTERLRRLIAIVRADFLIRFRRLSTLVVFLLLSVSAYAWIPDPATGRALLQVDGQRALYNSAAIGMGTATLAATVIGLIGFYVVSNPISRDVISRCGFVIASTTMRRGEYLVAKLWGNIVFLGTFTAGFMVSSMVMLLVRGEAALEPWVFVEQYLILVPPALVFAAVLAIVFESIPLLSGRIGDVIYFFLWITSIGIAGALIASGRGPGLIRYFDFSGFGFMIDQLQRTLDTPNFSIGSSNFDATKPVFVLQGLRLEGDSLLPRIGSLLTPLPLLGIAILSFHRFDPARVRSGREKGRKGWLTRIDSALKPLARLSLLLPVPRASQPSLLHAAATDALMTITAYPILLLVALGMSIATAASTSPNFMHWVLPIAIGMVGVVIADIPCRERRAGVLGLIHSAPLLKSGFVWWKLLAALFVAIGLLAVPLARVTFAHPSSIAAFGVGLVFVAALATALGVISGNPKAFIIVFLLYWYLVINDRGSAPGLDFAGFYGKAIPLVTLAYAAAAAAFLGVAQVVHSARMRRES